MSKINAGGFLTSLVEKVMSGGGLENHEKLNTHQLERISTYLGHVAKKGNLYNILFKDENIRLNLDGDEVNTKDLMWFVIMDHEFARGWYWKPSGAMTTDTSVCAGVPLAFKGAKRLFNKTYMSWLEEADETIECDIFLPQGLNSLRIDEEGEIVPEVKSQSRGGRGGLISLYRSDKFDFDSTHIHRLREEVPRYATTSKPKMVKPANISEDGRIGKVYNDLSHLMRCMLLQGWCWYNRSRNSDMITDFRDWDNFSKSIDSPSIAMRGLEPKTTRIATGYLKFTNTKEEDLMLKKKETHPQKEENQNPQHRTT